MKNFANTPNAITGMTMVLTTDRELKGIISSAGEAVAEKKIGYFSPGGFQLGDKNFDFTDSSFSLIGSRHISVIVSGLDISDYTSRLQVPLDSDVKEGQFKEFYMFTGEAASDEFFYNISGIESLTIETINSSMKVNKNIIADINKILENNLKDHTDERNRYLAGQERR